MRVSLNLGNYPWSRGPASFGSEPGRPECGA
jgi:hypothetical protein